MIKLFLSDLWRPTNGLFDIREISLPEVKALCSAFEVHNLLMNVSVSYDLVLYLESVELPPPASMVEVLMAPISADSLVLMVEHQSVNTREGWVFRLVRQFDRDKFLAVLKGAAAQADWDGRSGNARELADLAARLGGAM